MLPSRLSTPGRHPRRRRRALIIGASLALLVLAIAAASASAAPPGGIKTRIKSNTLTVTGTSAGETILLRLRPGDPTTLEIDAGNDGSIDFSYDRSKFNEIEVEAGGGNDTLIVSSAFGIFTDTELTRLNGEAGDDTILGGAGAEVLDGGAGNDILDGNQGNDTILGGAGDDVIAWDPGDGSDVVEGQAGADTLRFNGSNANELFDVSAIGGRVRFSRNIGAIVMDLDDVETLDLRALGGADGTTVNDLTGTDLSLVAVDLAGLGGSGDTLADTVTVNGTAGNDTIDVGVVSGLVEISGLAGLVRIAGAEVANDLLVVNGLAGTKTITIGVGVTSLLGVISNP
jgi:hypothetical protein